MLSAFMFSFSFFILFSLLTCRCWCCYCYCWLCTLYNILNFNLFEICTVLFFIRIKIINDETCVCKAAHSASFVNDWWERRRIKQNKESLNVRQIFDEIYFLSAVFFNHSSWQLWHTTIRMSQCRIYSLNRFEHWKRISF